MKMNVKSGEYRIKAVSVINIRLCTHGGPTSENETDRRSETDPGMQQKA